MRVAVLADIHGNLPALDAALDDIDAAGVDAIVLNGDIATRPMPAETLDRLAELGRLPAFRAESHVGVMSGIRTGPERLTAPTAADGWRAAAPRLHPHRRATLPPRSLSTAYESCRRRAKLGP